MTSESIRSVKRSGELKHVGEESPNWVIIVGGALLSTLSVRFCCKMKQIFDVKKSRKTHAPSKDYGILTPNKRSGSCKFHSQLHCFTQDEDGSYRCLSGVKHTPMSKDADDSVLPLVKVPSGHSSIDNGVAWASSPDRLEPPQKSFNHRNSSDSPCISESGSDAYNKREAVQRLRQQLKRRDDMIMEMQAQITYLQNSLTAQIAHSTELQAQLDSSNQQLLYSEREIQRLQKTTSDPKALNGHANGYLDGYYDDAELHCVGVEKAGGEDRIEMLKREVKELKEVIQGREFFIQSYKEHKMELCCSKMKELQLSLVSQSSST